ncbi:MAG: hypothetical protein H6752_10105 [Candidatus Omnitrophica bacterium]|nr:hypothetical protein [Candidatus Omnitrophota bacterium]
MKKTHAFLLLPSFLGIFSFIAFAGEFKGADGGAAVPADFDGDGRIASPDLLRLLPHNGASLGESDYGYLYDLNRNDRIGDEDLAIFADQWMETAQPGTPFPVSDVRQAMGFDNPTGTNWSFACMQGGTEDCTGGERTLTLGEPRTAFGRSGIPFIWGSGEGEPWAEILLSATGPLEILGVDKVGGPEGLPGFQIPANLAVELGGPIQWSTSEMFQPGRFVRNEGTGTLFATPTIKGFEGKGLGLAGLCLVFTSAWFNGANKEIDKGLPAGSYILYGEGTFDYGMGEAQANWDIVCREGRVRTIRLCWFHEEEKKCLTFGEMETSGNCFAEDEDFTDVFNGPIPSFQREECVSGSLENFDDQADWFSFNSLPSNSNLRVTGVVGQGVFLGIRIYVGSPLQSNLVDSGVLTGQGPAEFVVETESGEDCYVEVYQLDGIGGYEVTAETVIGK